MVRGASFALFLALAALHGVEAFLLGGPGVLMGSHRQPSQRDPPQASSLKMLRLSRPAYAPMQTASSKVTWGAELLRMFGIARRAKAAPVRTQPRPPRAGDSIVYSTLEKPSPAVLQEIALLCTSSIFGSDDGWRLILDTFENKYVGAERKVALAIASCENQIVGCIGMEMMLVNDQGLAWWRDPSADVLLRPFVSDLAVATGWRRYPTLPPPRVYLQHAKREKRIFIELTTSDRKLKASREGSK